MESTHHRNSKLKLEFPYHRMQNYLKRLRKLKELAALSTNTKKGKEALSWLTANKTLIGEILTRAKEPYYKMVPYRNRSDNGPSWQYDILWEAPNWKGRVACGANRIGKSQFGA